VNNKNLNFYSWLKPKITHSPPLTLDEKILMMAQIELNHSKKSLSWFIPISAFAAATIIFIAGNIYFTQQKTINKLVLYEVPELILNYDKIEMMADASQLSADEWTKIEGQK
jgi:hypothetical protein